MRFFWIIRAILLRPFFYKVGFLSYLGKPVFLYGCRNIELGKNVHIFPGVRMETHNRGRIVIDDNVSIGQNFHITSGQCDLRIGRNTTISGNVFITNIDHDYEQIGIHVLKQHMFVKRTEIGENCFIGFGAGIQAGTILGRQCVVGTNAVVRGIYPDYCVLVGVPARVIKRYDIESCVWRRTKPDGTFI